MTRSRCTVRAASADDLPALRRLASAAFDLEPVQRAHLIDLLFDRPPAERRLRIVADAGDEVVGCAFGSRHGATGYVDAIAVAEQHRRGGVGTALLDALETELRHEGAEALQIGGNTWFYAWPGIDLGYTGALCFAERAAYTEIEQVQNMDVPLAAWVPGSGTQPKTGAEIRRATAADWPDLEPFISERFFDEWRHEANLAVHRSPSATFIAMRNRTIVGFACHGVYRVDCFGPLAVDASERGAGTGEALLRACLDDLAAAGISTAQIGWIGPMHFYARTVGARLGRRFAVLRKPAH